MATRLEAAIARVIEEGKVRTYDMGGKDSTLDVAKAIADYAHLMSYDMRQGAAEPTNATSAVEAVLCQAPTQNLGAWHKRSC